MKRILAISLALVLFVGMIPAQKAGAEESLIHLYHDNITEELAVAYYGGIGSAREIFSTDFYYDDEKYQMKYQWYKKVGDSYVKIEGATELDYPIAKVDATDFTLFRQELSLYEGDTKKETKNCYYRVANNYNLTVDDETPDTIFFDDVLPTLTVHATCDAEKRDEIQYQWYSVFYSSGAEEDREETIIEGATSSTYQVTEEILKTTSTVFCSVSLPGVPEGCYFGDRELRRATSSADLSQSNYSNVVDLEQGEVCVQHIKGKADTQAMTLTFTSQYYSMAYVQDAEGHSFYISLDDSGKTEFTLKGNECYVMTQVEQNNISSLKSVTESDSFTKQPYSLEMNTYPDKDSTYYLGDTPDLTGLKLNCYYTDGTIDVLSCEDLTWDKEKKMESGLNEIVVTEPDSGMTYTLYLYASTNIDINWDVKPQRFILGNSVQKASVKVNHAPSEVGYLWMLTDEQDNTIAEVENDTEAEITIPQDIPSGTYKLMCYYYPLELGFDAAECLYSSFTILNDNVFQPCDTLPESEHDFSKTDEQIMKGFSYQEKGASSLLVTFDEKTSLDYFDYLTLYDVENNQTTYTGKELAGKTVEVMGDTLRIFLAASGYSEGWGFKVIKVEKKMAPNPTAMPQPTQTPVKTPQPSQTPTPLPSVKPADDNDNNTVRTPSITVKANGKKTAAIKIKKVWKATGYQIAYSRNSKLKKSVKKITTKKLSIKVKKLKSRKMYYFKVRACQKSASGKKEYSKWSKIKKVKIK